MDEVGRPPAADAPESRASWPPPVPPKLPVTRAAPWSPVDPVAWPVPAPSAWHSGSDVPPSHRPAPTRRIGAVLVGLAAVVALLVAAGLAVPRVLQPGTGLRSVAGETAGVPGGTPSSGPGATSADRESAITALLARRGDAVTRDDATAWRRTQTSSAKVPVFARLAALPITEWVYDVRSLDLGPDAATAVLDVRLHLRFDVDISDAVVHERVTVRRGSSGWLVVAEATADRRAQPWDLGRLNVVRGTDSLVIGIDTPTATLRAYARLADSSIRDVTAVWGSGWSRHAVLVVPRTVGQLARALARSAGSLEGYAAVTTGDLPSDDSSPPALRVWTNTPGMADLSALGREVVVRHEITHVATNAPGEAGVPLWLEEGFAEYVGYRGTGIALTEELSDLVRAERRGTAPRQLPTEAMFDGAQVDLAYEGADLACRLVAERYGQAQLLRLYRLTVAGSGTEAQNLEAALRAVTGSGTAAFEAAWRARLRALAS